MNPGRPGPTTDRPERVRLHEADGSYTVGTYEGLTADREAFVLRDDDGALVRVPREKVVRVEALTTRPPPEPPPLAEGPAPAPGPRPSPPRYTERQLLDTYTARTAGFGAGALAAIGLTTALRVRFHRATQRVDCETERTWDEEFQVYDEYEYCSEGLTIGAGDFFASGTSWLLTGGGVTFVALMGRSLGQRSAITRPDGRRALPYTIAGASVLLAGVSYFFVSRIPILGGPFDQSRGFYAANEAHFAAAAATSYIGAGLLGFGVGRENGLRRRQLSVAPSLTPTSGLLTLTLSPRR